MVMEMLPAWPLVKVGLPLTARIKAAVGSRSLSCSKLRHWQLFAVRLPRGLVKQCRHMQQSSLGHPCPANAEAASQFALLPNLNCCNCGSLKAFSVCLLELNFDLFYPAKVC